MDVMEFNGKDYCEIPLTNSIVNTLDGSFSIGPWVKPSDDLILDDTKHYDEFHIFTKIFHTGLAFYKWYGYKGSVWDKDEEQHMVVSDRKNSEWCHVCSL